MVDSKEYLKSKGIHYELSAPFSPTQNERTNQTLMESARAMFAQAGLPKHFWVEAVAILQFTYKKQDKRRQRLTRGSQSP